MFFILQIEYKLFVSIFPSAYSDVPLSFKDNFHLFQFLGVGFYLCALAKITACDLTRTLVTFHMYHTCNVKRLESIQYFQAVSHMTWI